MDGREVFPALVAVADSRKKLSGRAYRRAFFGDLLSGRSHIRARQLVKKVSMQIIFWSSYVMQQTTTLVLYSSTSYV